MANIAGVVSELSRICVRSRSLAALAFLSICDEDREQDRIRFLDELHAAGFGRAGSRRDRVACGALHALRALRPGVLALACLARAAPRFVAIRHRIARSGLSRSMRRMIGRTLARSFQLTTK